MFIFQDTEPSLEDRVLEVLLDLIAPEQVDIILVNLCDSMIVV